MRLRCKTCGGYIATKHYFLIKEGAPQVCFKCQDKLIEKEMEIYYSDTPCDKCNSMVDCSSCQI